MESATGGSVTGADAAAVGGGSAPSLDAIFSGEQPMTSLPETFGERPEAKPETPAAPATPEAKAAESQAEEKVEAQPTEQSEEQEYQEPLPEKLDQLAKTLSKTNPELARQLRSDYFALNGPDGYRSIMRTVEEAREYKTIAPTVDDLRTMAEYAQRYDGLDNQYINDPQGMIRTLAEDGEAFSRVAASFEPALRSGDPRLYELAARPFNDNFWRNVMATVSQNGTPEEIELFTAFQQKYLPGMNGNGGRQTQAFGQSQMQQPQQQFQAEREAWNAQRREDFFNSSNSELTPMLKGEVRKYLEEKVGGSIPEAVRDDYLDEMSGSISSRVWSEINGNPIIRSEVARMIEGGDLSLGHKQQFMERVMTRARAFLPQKSAPEITRVMGRLRKLSGGTTNQTASQTSQATQPEGATKDVGSGSPTVGSPTGAPKGFPPGWNAMRPQQRMDALEGKVDWGKTDRNLPSGYSSTEEYLSAVCAGFADASRLVLKGNA